MSDSTEKIKLKAAKDAFDAAAKALTDEINADIADGKVTATEKAAVNAKYTTFNEKYKEYIAALNNANLYISNQVGIEAKKSALEEIATKYGYLLNGLGDIGTTISGGLIVSSMLALGYKDEYGNVNIESGISGIFSKSKLGNGIASWWGGNMVDKDDMAEGETPATSIIRFDGSGYLANGAISWDTTGKVTADPMSFFVGEDSVGALLLSFQVVYDKESGKVVPQYIIPKVPFQNLSIANSINIGGAYLKYDSTNKALYVEDKDGKAIGFYSKGWISAYGVNSSGGGGGSDFNLLTNWNNYNPSTATTYALGANLAKSMYDDIALLKNGSIVTVTTSGNGNVLTAVTKDGATISFVKGMTAASQSDFTSHANNTNIHITAAERTKWDGLYTDFHKIVDTPDTDNIINKWGEIVEFLAGYTETTKLADLLATKQDVITDLDTIRSNASTAYSWGNHASQGYLKSVAYNDLTTKPTKTQLDTILGLGSFAYISSISYNDLAIKPTSAQIQALVGNYVTTFGTKTGAVTVRGGLTANGSVNLAMSNNELQASIVGLGSLAYKSSLVANDIPALAISKITNLQTSLDAKLAASTFNDLFEKVTKDGVTYIKAKYGFMSVGFVSAYGLNSSGSGGGGADLSPTTWTASADFTTTKALAANLGWNLNTRVTSLENGGIVSISTSGTGNAVTAVSKSGNGIAFTFGKTFMETSHAANSVTSTKIGNWDTAYGWGNHASAGYVKSSGVTSITIKNGTGITGGSNTATTSTGTYTIGLTTAIQTDIANGATAYGWGNHASEGYLKSVAYNDLTTKPTAAQIQALVGNYVTTFGTKTGSITVRGSQTANGSVNLSMSNNQLQASIVGLAALAYKASIAYDDLSTKPTTAQIKTILGISDWALAASKPSYAWSEVTGKPTFATVATSGSYNDLSNKPTIPTKASWNYDDRYLQLTGGTINGTLYFNPTDSSDAAPYIKSEVNEGVTLLVFRTADDTNDGFVFRNRYWDNGEDTDTLSIKYSGIVANKNVTVNGSLKIGDATLSWDDTNKCLKVDKGFVSTSYISAFGINSSGGGGGGADLSPTTWTSSSAFTTSLALASNLGWDLHSRVSTLEGGSATNITTNGTGNAITSVSKSGTTLTFVKGSTFAEDANVFHTNFSDNAYDDTAGIGKIAVVSSDPFNNGSVCYGSILQMSNNGANKPSVVNSVNWYWQLMGLTSGNLQFRRRTNGGAWTAWKAVAFTDSNITGTAAGITGYSFKTATAATHSGWTGNATDDKLITTQSMIAFWNGAYNANGSSNLTYCKLGSFGTSAIHSHGTYVTSIGTSGNTITWEKGGVAQTAITVPYSTTSGTANIANVLFNSDIDGSSYVSADTRIVYLGYMDCSGSYDRLQLSISNAFWGNQHGFHDIITIHQSNNVNSGQTAVVKPTVERVHLGGKYAITYYYKPEGSNKLHIYADVYGTSGNGDGRWSISVLNGGTNSGTYYAVNIWHTVGTKNVTKEDSWVEIPYGGIINKAHSLYTSRTLWGNSFDGSADISGDITMNNNKYVHCKNTSGTAVNLLGLSGNVFIIGNGAAENGYSTYLSGNVLLFRTNTTKSERMRITADGYVGINTVSPETHLQVNGGVKFLSSTWGNTTIYRNANGAAVIKYENNTSGILGYIGVSGSKKPYCSIDSTDYLLVRSTNNTAVGNSNRPVYIDANGVATACNQDIVNPNLWLYTGAYDAVSYTGWVDANNGDRQNPQAPYTTWNGFGVQRIETAWRDYSQIVAVSPNTTYTLSAWIRWESAAGSMFFYTNNGSGSGTDVTSQVGTTDYKRVSFTFTTNSSATQSRCRFECSTNTPYLICGLKLEEGSVATAWCPNPSDCLISNHIKANTLSTPRRLWGQSFDGSANVSGWVYSASGITKYASTNDSWSDGTNTHPWHGIDFSHHNTGVYSTTISDYFGMTFKTSQGSMCITSDGNVGIGTLTPSKKLDVSGNVRSDSLFELFNKASGINADLFRVEGNPYGTNSASRGGKITLYGISPNATSTAAGTQEEKLRMFVDGEGGNIRWFAPSTYKYYYDNAGHQHPIYYEMDAFNGNFRLYTQSTGTATQAGSYITWTFANNGYTYLPSNVGIGTSNPSQKLHVSGNILASGEITAYSDARLKSDIEDLDWRGALMPKKYVKDGRKQIGFIAQDVQELYPELVTEQNDEMRTLSLNYGAITAVLAAQINNVDDEVTTLKKRVRELEKEVEQLKN